MVRTRRKPMKFNFDFKVHRNKKNSFDAEQRELDYEFKLRMEKLSRKVGECHEQDPNSGVVFLKNFPHAFAEQPMRKFFTQFGRIKRLRISRSRKSGKSKGFGYIEFEYLEVAKIVAETMNNYLMFRQIMKCELVPKDKLHPKTFKGCFQKSFKPMSRRIAIEKMNKYVEATPTEVCGKLKKKVFKEKKNQKILAEMGIDYEITGHYRDEYAAVKSKLEKMQPAVRLHKEAARAKVGGNLKKGTEESDDSEKEDDLKSDEDSEMETAEGIMGEKSPRKGNKRKLEMDRNEAIDKARKIQKEIQTKAESESEKMDQNKAVDKTKKVQKEIQNKEESESEEDAESSSDESDISTEEEKPTEVEPIKTKPLSKLKTPEETNKKRSGTPGSEKQRLMEQESGSVGKKLGSEGRLNADKVTPFKGGRSVVKGTPKSVGKKPIPRKSFKKDNITTPKGQRPTMEQTSKSTGKKSTGTSKLDSDLVTPTKVTNSPRQQLSKSTGKKSVSKNSFEKETVTPATGRPLKQTSKSTGKKGMGKSTKTPDATTPGKGQRLAMRKMAKSTGKKDLSKRRVPMST